MSCNFSKQTEYHTQQGFTLVELMLVVALLGVSIGVTNDILMSLVRSNTKTQVMNEIEQQSNFVSMKLERELRNARIIITPEPSSPSGPKLVFETKDGRTIEYDVETNSSSSDYGLIKRKVDAGSLVNLTSNNNPGGVKVECGSPSCFSIIGFNPQIVSVNMMFLQSQSGASSSYTGQTSIQTSVVVRNTY